MNKAKTFILKSPILMAVISFLTTIFILLIVKLLLKIPINLETVLIPIAIITIPQCERKLKEKLPFQYRFKYSLTLTLIYLIINLIFISYVTKNNPNLFQTLVTIATINSLIIYFSAYYVSIRLSKRLHYGNYEQILNEQKKIPIEIQKKRKITTYSLLAVAFFTIILFSLNGHHIITISKGALLLLSLSFLAALIFTVVYLKKIEPQKSDTIENDE